MTSITGNSYIDSLTTKTSVTGTKAKGNGTMDQSSFLKLMTTQLKTQDPTAPTDNTQMIAQMAQFSQVAGVAEMNASLKNILSEFQSSRMGDAASWIGRSALVPSKTALPLTDGSYAGQVTLPAEATSASVRLVDANNSIVKQIDLGKQPQGDVGFAWDGKDGAGRAVPGPVRIEVTAKGATGVMQTSTAAWTTVNGVQSPAGGTAAKLITGLGNMNPSDALSLS